MRPPATAALFVATMVSPVSGEPAPSSGDVHLTWNAPDGCPSTERVLAEVERILAGSRSRHAETHADVTRLAADRWWVHLVTDVDGTPGERSFEADSCAALASATALIVAWTIDPLRSAGSPTVPEPAALASTTPMERTSIPSTETVSRISAERPLRQRPSLSGVLAIAVAGDLGTLPRAGWAAEITAGAILRHLRVEASGSGWSGQSATTTAAEGAELRLREGALRGCWRGILGRAIEADPCLGLGVAHLTSQGFGETSPYRRDAWWWVTHGDLLVTWTLAGPLALRALVGVAVPLARPPVVILGSQSGNVPLHQPSAVAGRAALGLEVHFP